MLHSDNTKAFYIPLQSNSYLTKERGFGFGGGGFPVGMQRKLCAPRKAGKGKGKGKKGQAAKQSGTKRARKVPAMPIQGTGLALPGAASFGAASSSSPSSSQQNSNSLTLREELGLTKTPDKHNKQKRQGNRNLTPTTEKMSTRLGNGRTSSAPRQVSGRKWVAAAMNSFTDLFVNESLQQNEGNQTWADKVRSYRTYQSDVQPQQPEQQESGEDGQPRKKMRRDDGLGDLGTMGNFNALEQIVRLRKYEKKAKAIAERKAKRQEDVVALETAVESGTFPATMNWFSWKHNDWKIFLAALERAVVRKDTSLDVSMTTAQFRRLIRDMASAKGTQADEWKPSTSLLFNVLSKLRCFTYEYADHEVVFTCFAGLWEETQT